MGYDGYEKDVKEALLGLEGKIRGVSHRERHWVFAI